MISSQAHIHDSAVIGNNVTIEAFSFIGANVVIGDACWIGPNCTIMEGTRIGQSCRIFPGSVLGGEPQDMKYQGEASTVTIGDRVTIRECVTINRGTQLDRGDTKVGDDCMIMAYTHIAHDCVVEDHVILANAVQMAGHVKIGSHAFVGGTTAIHQHVNIGAHSMISGGSLVRKDVPPFITAAREPLTYLGINSIGLRRRGFENERINDIQGIYKTFYQSGMNNTVAIDHIRAEMTPSVERDQIITFIEASTRGMIRGYQED